MARVFFISDIHLYHYNLIEKYLRTTVNEHLKLIISNWNKTVSKKDIVYVIGDLTLGKSHLIPEIFNQLNGIIRVIGGNHDDRNTSSILNSLNIPMMGCMDYKGFIVTHIPIHPLELDGFYRGNIHGHVHDPKVDYGSKYLNVVCERINFTPIEFTELLLKHKYKLKDE